MAVSRDSIETGSKGLSGQRERGWKDTTRSMEQMGVGWQESCPKRARIASGVQEQYDLQQGHSAGSGCRAACWEVRRIERIGEDSSIRIRGCRHPSVVA